MVSSVSVCGPESNKLSQFIQYLINNCMISLNKSPQSSHASLSVQTIIIKNSEIRINQKFSKSIHLRSK